MKDLSNTPLAFDALTNLNTAINLNTVKYNPENSLNLSEKKIRSIFGLEDDKNDNYLIDIDAITRLLEENHDSHDGHDDHDSHDNHESHGSHDSHDHGDHNGHDDDQRDKPWGHIVLASLIVNLATLIGVITVFLPRLCKGPSTPGFFERLVLPSFASGALLATCAFLLIPESLELLGGGHDDHSDHDDHSGHDHRFLEEDSHDEHGGAAWKFGTALLIGFLFPIVFQIFLPATHAHGSEDGAHVLEEKDDEEKAKEQDNTNNSDNASEEKPSSTPQKRLNWGLASSILLGDFVHNFTDGVFIGNAFVLCDLSVAYTMAASTLYHELSQEIADFSILTNQCGFTTVEALVLNFVSGISVLLGALLIAVADVNMEVTGGILAVGAGVYIYITGTECVPPMLAYLEKEKSNKIASASAIFSFVIGAVPIGLVLLNHSHGCS